MKRSIWFAAGGIAAAAMALAACKKSEPPAGSGAPAVIDAASMSDAPEPVIADAVAAQAIDAVEAADAAEVIDGGATDAALPIDAARAHVAIDARGPADARPVVAPPDAAPPPPPIDAGAVAVPAGAPCRHAKFSTTMIADACAHGGQAEAKAAMKKFVRGAKPTEPALECGTCHSKLAPEYPLKADGLAHFKKLGGT